jgi:hypothetical protein
MPARSVHDEPCKDRSMAYLILLSALPSIRMSQDKVDIVLDGSPEGGRMSILDVNASAFIKVSHEICKDLNCRFIPRKSWNVGIADLRRCQVFRAEVKFPPIQQNVSVSEKHGPLYGQLTIRVSPIPRLPRLR